MKKNKENNKSILITICILIIIIILFIIIMILNKHNARPINKVKYVDDIVQNVFYNKNITKKELEDTIHGTLIEDFVFVGKDSNTRHLPKNNLVKKYKLDEYVKLQKKYADKVETTAMKNIEYKVTQEGNNYIVYDIKPWYAFNYSIDVDYLKDIIMKDAGFVTKSDNNETEEYGLNEFKARTIAMKILDTKLDDYNNTDNEIVTLKFSFENGKPSNNQLLSLYFNMQGVTSKKCLVKLSEQDRENEKEKMKNYLIEAEQNGLYDKNNPYKI